MAQTATTPEKTKQMINKHFLRIKREDIPGGRVLDTCKVNPVEFHGCPDPPVHGIQRKKKEETKEAKGRESP